MKYINKGRRKFIIRINNNVVEWSPLEIVELNEKDYLPLKDYKEIAPIKEAKVLSVENEEVENKKGKKNNGKANNIE